MRNFNGLENKLPNLTNLSQITWFDVLCLLPEIYLLLMSLVLLVFVGLFGEKSTETMYYNALYTKNWIYNICNISLRITLLLSSIQLILFLNQSFTIFTNYTITDFYTCVMKITIIAIIIILLKITEQETSKLTLDSRLEYPVIFLLLTLFLMILISAYNFITVFLGIVGLSLTLYILLLNDVLNQASKEAGIKYFYLSIISSSFLISGIFLSYLIFNSTGFMAIIWLIHNWHLGLVLEPNIFLIIIMLYLIIFGFFFKLAAFPCHLWAPEIYDGSPNILMSIFILPIKIATFALFIRILGHTFADLYQYWYYILWFSSCFSMFWGCFGALIEQNIKKFLAYSSINQMGFLLMGIACGTFEGFRASLIYLFLYILMNIGFFLVYLTTRNLVTNAGLLYITDFNSFAKTNFYYSISLVIILFSMAGIPPLGGFFGKYFLFVSCFETGNFGLVLMGMFTSVIGAYYYLRIIKIMWFEEFVCETTKFITTLSDDYKQYLFRIEFFLIFFIVFIKLFLAGVNLLTIVALNPIAIC